MPRYFAVVFMLSACAHSPAPPASQSCVGVKEQYRFTLVELAQKALDDASHGCRASCESDESALIELGARALALATRLEDHRSFATLPAPPAGSGEAVRVAHERATMAQRRWRSCRH
ncbi:MAG: hypothetical protein AAGE52_11370 [Myxococcota bacterium]